MVLSEILTIAKDVKYKSKTSHIRDPILVILSGDTA